MATKTLTRSAYQRIEEKVLALQKKREEMLVELEETRKLGDLRENSAYHELKNQIQILEEKIVELEEILKNAQIVEKQKNGEKKVGLGSKVVLQMGEKKRELEIVSDGEADPAEGKISYSSPLAEALCGKKEGEEVKVATPAGENTYKILRVEN